MKGMQQIDAKRAALAAVACLGLAHAAAADYTGSGGVLNDALDEPGVTTFTINVGDAGTIDAFGGLTLTSLQHTWCGDLQITLTAPDASSISIVDRIGYTGSLFGDSSNYLGTYTFANGGADIWALATAQGNGTGFNIPSGTYAASGFGSGAALDLTSFFLGKSAQGMWKLTITDFESGDGGSLGSWSLNMSVVPGPGAWALFAVAAIGRGRRRN